MHPARIVTLILRCLALICSMIALVLVIAAFFRPDAWQAIAGSAIAAIMLWLIGNGLDHWSTRHARRRLRELLATADAKGDSLHTRAVEQPSPSSNGKLRITQLATSPSTRGLE